MLWQRNSDECVWYVTWCDIVIFFVFIVKVIVVVVALELVEAVVVGTLALRPPSLSQTTIAELELIASHLKLFSTNVKERSLLGREWRRVCRKLGLGEEDWIREVLVQLGEVQR